MHTTSNSQSITSIKIEIEMFTMYKHHRVRSWTLMDPGTIFSSYLHCTAHPGDELVLTSNDHNSHPGLQWVDILWQQQQHLKGRATQEPTTGIENHSSDSARSQWPHKEINHLTHDLDSCGGMVWPFTWRWKGLTEDGHLPWGDKHFS